MYKLLKFGAPWCAQCRYATKDLEKNTLPSNVKLEEINVEDNDAMVEHYDITTLPTFILTKDNMGCARMVGYPGFIKLKEWLDKYATE